MPDAINGEAFAADLVVGWARELVASLPQAQPTRSLVPDAASG